MAALNDMIERGRSSYQKTSAVYARSGLFVFLMGVLFTAMGYFMGIGDSPNYFFLALGLLFVAYGFVQIYNAKRYRDK